MGTRENSYRTAISRRGPSAPMKRLASQGLLTGRMLDYGCGKGLDARHYGMVAYDPHFAPTEPEGLFDVITCNYVLNVIESPAERALVLERIRALLVPGGRAYITIRRDVKVEGTTSRGTYQENVVMDLPSEWKTSAYETYRMEG